MIREKMGKYNKKYMTKNIFLIYTIILAKDR